MKETDKRPAVSSGTVIVTYTPEKLKALYKYMGDKDANLEAEVVDFIDHLYERYVPPTVKQYIDFMLVGSNGS